MLSLLRPRFVMPFHGDHKRLQLHGRLAESLGIESDRVFRGENGQPLEVTADRARWADKVKAGVIYVDGTDLGGEDDTALQDRRTISADGVLIVVATISAQTGRAVAEPEVVLRGVPAPRAGAPELLDAFRDAVAATLDREVDDGEPEVEHLKRLLHDELAELAWSKLRRRPMVVPVVVAV